MGVLKDLPKIIKKLKELGFQIEKFNGYLNSRKAYYINGLLMTDYQIVNMWGGV